MTTATAVRRPSRLSRAVSPFTLRRLHSFTGILFGFYVLIHLFINATLVLGLAEGQTRTVYQVQVNRIHSFPFLIPMECLLIYIPILYHAIYGLWLTYASQPNVSQYPYARNIFYTFQHLTGLLLVFFIFFHVCALKGLFGHDLSFEPRDATATVVRHLNTNWFLGGIIYPIAVLCACFHLAYGFWTAAITWGITVSDRSQRTWGKICCGVFVFSLLCGFTALAAGLCEGKS